MKYNTDKVMRLPTSADALKTNFPAKANVTVVPDHNLAIADQLPS